MADAVTLRDVQDSDLPIFFEQQRDPRACRMAAFIQRDPDDRAAFDAHWAKIRSDPAVLIRTVLADGRVAGSVAGFELGGRREVCYWVGREFWGRGIASAALSQYLLLDSFRPHYAGVAADNFGSIRVLEKCGFVLVERKRSFARGRGEEIDELVLILP